MFFMTSSNLPTLISLALLLGLLNLDAKSPNLIIFMLDDVDYGDIGRFGGKQAATLHLDKMATEGMRMTDFYVHPVCEVRRASLLTEFYAMQVAEVASAKNGQPILHPKEITHCGGDA